MFITADIGGTMIRVAAFDSLTDSHVVKRQEFRHEVSYRNAISRLDREIESFSADGTCDGMAVSITGWVENNTLTSSANLPDWKNRPIAEDLAAAAGCPVTLINDAEAAARGEARYGEVNADFWLIIWGTGLGGAIVHPDRRVEYRGAPGHSIQLSNNTECPCGKRGCWETYVGGAAIRRRYGKPAGELSTSQWDEVCRYMAEGLFMLLKRTPMPTIVFGGGIALNHHERLGVVHQYLSERMEAPPQFRLATLGEDAGLLGALAYLQRT